MAAKNKGNKYFRGGRYEQAIKCYTQAIEFCPEAKTSDLSTFYQNRAAAFEQLEKDESVVSDCSQVRFTTINRFYCFNRKRFSQ